MIDTRHTTATPAAQPDTEALLAAAWAEIHSLIEERQALPERFREAAEQGDAAAMKRLLQRASAIADDLAIAYVVARRRAVLHAEAEVRRAEAAVDATRDAGVAARRAYEQGFSAPRDADGNVLPPPPEMAAFQRAQEAVGEAQASLLEARRHWDEQLETAVRGFAR